MIQKFKTKGFFLPFLVVLLIFITSCDDDCDTASTPTSISSITDLDTIEVSLVWDDAYDTADIFDFLVGKAYAVLPPDYQPHYSHKLVFDHRTETITDTLKSFTGSDSSAMTVSEITRDTSVYIEFQQLLENKEYFCKVSREILLGPSQAKITFIKTDGTFTEGCFYGENTTGSEGYELCSKDFSTYLDSLQTSR